MHGTVETYLVLHIAIVENENMRLLFNGSSSRALHIYVLATDALNPYSIDIFPFTRNDVDVATQTGTSDVMGAVTLKTRATDGDRFLDVCGRIERPRREDNDIECVGGSVIGRN